MAILSLINPNEFKIIDGWRENNEKNLSVCRLLIEKWTPELECQMLEAFIKLYYDDMYKNWGPDDQNESEKYWPKIKSPTDLLQHTGRNVSLYALEDGIYAKSITGEYELQDDIAVILTLECPWDEEHGWAAVFINERFVKVDRDIVGSVRLD